MLHHLRSAGYYTGYVPIRVSGINSAGIGYVYDISVTYGSQIGSLECCLSGPWWKPLEGFALEKDGEVVYKSLSDVTVTEPIQLYGVYKTVQHTVTMQIYDDTVQDYVTYKTFTVNKGDQIPTEVFDEAKAAVPQREGVTWNCLGWEDQDGTAFEADITRISQDTVLRMKFDREVEITFDPGEGTLVANEKNVSYSTDNYKVRLSGIVKKEEDAYDTYKPIGWKNDATGEIYGYQDIAVIDDPVTLTAIYEATPKEYKVSVYTALGTLKNGQQTDSYAGGYDGYLEFMEKYDENWKPDTVVNQDKTYTCAERLVRTLDDGLTTEISYRWNYVNNQYTLSFDANGGVLDGLASVTETYGRELKLSDVATAAKSDKTRDYVLSGWQDEDGKVYGTDDVITLTKDTKLTAIWTNGASKEYKITYILDGSVYKEDEVAAVGSTVTVVDAPVLTGYDVSDWTAEKMETAENVTITNGSFVMPDGEVVLKATTTPKKYQITVNVDGEPVTGSPFTAEYLSRFALPDVAAKDGMTFYWENDSEDFSVTEENGTYYVNAMPAQNITVNGYYTEKTHNIYFVVENEEGEWEPYKIIENVPVGLGIIDSSIRPELKEEDAAAGKKFLGWVSFETEKDKEGVYKMPDHDVYYYTRWAPEESTDASVNIVFYLGDPTLEDYPEGEEPAILGWWEEIYLEEGEALQLPDYQIEGYTLKWIVDDDPDGQYEYDSEENTFTFKKLKDGQTISVPLSACYIKNEE